MIIILQYKAENEEHLAVKLLMQMLIVIACNIFYLYVTYKLHVKMYIKRL
jgi:hypothetical protein